MTAAGIVAALALLAFILTYRPKPDEPEQAARSEYDAAQLCEIVRELAAICAQLENADRMIADLDACNPRSLLRSFRAQWCGIDGKSRSIDFLADGANQTTAGLKEAAQDERERINREILATVRAMQAAIDSGDAPAIRLDVVGGTVDGTTQTTAAGEW